MIVKQPQNKDIVIDLMGQAGNAYWLLGYVKDLGKALGFDADKIKEIQEDMTSGNYNHLVAVFEMTFGRYVTLEASEELLEEVATEIDRLNALRRDECAISLPLGQYEQL